jgi:hypothetical protein
MALEYDFLGSSVVLAGVTAIIILIGIYVYFAFAWRTIAKRMRHKKPWLAFIPFANIALFLQLGGIHWAWTFLALGIFLAATTLGTAMILILTIFIIIAHWKVYQKLNYPGWLSLSIILCLFSGIIGIPIYAVITGIIAWKNNF